RQLCEALRGQIVPLPLFWQHMPAAQEFADAPLDPEQVLIWRVTKSLADYHAACGVGNK
ncbi:tagatose-bisphosphate aldolase, partial [Mesorhizobium sp. M1A.T.Ca.IN.004.03.1.1]